MLFGATHTH